MAGLGLRAELPEVRSCQPRCQLRTSQIYRGKVRRIILIVFDYAFKVVA